VLSVGAGTRIMMAVAPIDLRRGHDGLVSLVRDRCRGDPYSGELYVFFGRRMDRIKILFFSVGGFVVYYKRLERGRFTLPAVPAGADRVVVDAATLALLLDGVDVRSIKRAPLWKPPKRDA
jgi:transposase